MSRAPHPGETAVLRLVCQSNEQGTRETAEPGGGDGCYSQLGLGCLSSADLKGKRPGAVTPTLPAKPWPVGAVL